MTGILRRARVVALPIMAILCLVVATAATSARNTTSTCTAVKAVTVCTTLNTATFKFSTSVKTKASVSTSIDTSYALTVLDQRPKKVHTITIPEAPAKLYHFKVTATPTTGKASTWTGVFKTDPYGSVPMNIAKRGSNATLNGVPFFVIANKSECPTSQMAGFDFSIGVNVEENTASACPDANASVDSNAQELHAILGGELGWRDMHGVSQPSPVGLPELLNWGTGIRVTFQPDIPQNGCGTQRNMTEPLYKYASQHSSNGQPVVYTRGIATFRLANGFKPCFSGQRLRNIFWTVIEAGGAGLEYAYETYNEATGVTQQELQADVQTEAKRSADQIATLEAAFGSGKSVRVKTSGCATVHPRFVIYGGVIYGVAVNNDDAVTACTFSLPSTANQVVQRLWEPGVLKAMNHTFGDRFTNLGVHLYKVMPLMKK